MDDVSKLPIRAEVQLRYEDYEQAMAASEKRQSEKLRQLQRGSKLFWVWTVGFGVLVFALFQLHSQWDPYMVLRPPMYILGTLLLPIIVAWLVVLGAQAPASGLGRGWVRASIGWLPFGVLLIASGYVVLRQPQVDYYHDWMGAFFPQMAWTLYAGVLGTMLFRLNRKRVVQAWEFQPNLLRKQDVEIDETGMRVDEQVARREAGWTAFVRFSETPDTLLLWMSDVSFEILPKRAFGSTADLEAARRIFQSYIRDVDASPRAFEVLPAGTASFHRGSRGGEGDPGGAEPGR